MLQIDTCSKSCLTEEVKTHVVVGLLFGLLDLGGGSWGVRCSSSSSRGSRGESRGVGQVSLQLLSSREGDLGLGSDGHQVLEAVDHGVRCGGHGGVADLQAHSSHESGLEVIVGDVKDLGAEDGAVVVHV